MNKKTTYYLGWGMACGVWFESSLSFISEYSFVRLLISAIIGAIIGIIYGEIKNE